MENTSSPNERKVMIGFKCSPALRILLTQQARELGITLSYHIETCLLGHTTKEEQHKELTGKLKKREERIAFYEEAPLLQNLYKIHQGKTITYTDQDNKTVTRQISDIQDIFIVMINAFKTKKD